MVDSEFRGDFLAKISGIVSKRIFTCLTVVALASVASPVAEGHGRSGGSERSGRNDHGGDHDGNKGWYGGGSNKYNYGKYNYGKYNYTKQQLYEAYKKYQESLVNDEKPAEMPAEPTPATTASPGPADPTPSTGSIYSQAADPYGQLSYGQQSNGQTDSATDQSYGGDPTGQTEYFNYISSVYKSAAAKTRTIGLLATAEGLGDMSDIAENGTKIGNGNALVAVGLQSLEAGEKLSQLEEETLVKMQQTPEAASLDPEIMEDPLAKEILSNLEKKTGYSTSEIQEKILSSRGELDLLAENFPAAGKRKEEILAAKQATPEEINATLIDTKSIALQKKMKFDSLREALARSAPLRQVNKANDVSSRAPVLAVKPLAFPARPAKALASRAPASQPEFPNIGEDLPSFDLESSQTEEANEYSLFEKVHRKYSEIAPAMARRPK